MGFISESDQIAEVLTSIDGVKCITRGWPSVMDRETLPCIIVQKAGERGAGRRDDQEYLTEIEYYIRVFARVGAEADRVAAAAQACLLSLGYERVFGWEEFTEDICRVDMRVRAYRG